MRPLRLRSIRGKLVASFLVTIAALVAVGYFCNTICSNTRQRMLRSAKTESAAAVARALDLYLDSVAQTALTAASHVKNPEGSDLSACLAEIQRRVPYVVSLALMPAGTDQAVGAPDSHGGVRVSNLSYSGTGTPTFTMDVMTVLRDGQAAVVRPQISAAAVAEILQRICDGGAGFVLTDGEGRVVCASPGSPFACGDSLAATMNGAVGGTAHLSFCNWTVTTLNDSAAAQTIAGADRMRFSILILISALGLVLAFRFGNKMSANIHRLERSASALAVGDLRKRFSVVSGDEFEKLADALNLMAESTEKRERDISELSSALEGLFSVARAAASSLDLGEILRAITRTTADILSAKACAIYLLEPDGRLAIREAYNLSEEFIEEVRLEVGQRWTGVAVETRHWITATGLSGDSDNPLRAHAERAGLDSLLSAPLIAGTTVLGAITVWTGELRQFSALDVHVLSSIAGHAASVIQNARLYDKESRIAEALQSNLVGRVPLSLGPLTFGTKYLPALDEAQVGGDFFDIFTLPDGQVAVIVADVSGKGLQAAMHTAMVKFILRAYALENSDDPGRAMERLNQALIRSSSQQLFVTVLLVVVDPEREMISFANAGHPPAILITPDGKQHVLLYKTGMPAGWSDTATYSTKSAEFYPGSRLFLYTDGITESRGNGVMFGIEGVEASLFETPHLTAQQMVDTVCAKATGFTLGGTSDDIAIVAVEFAQNPVETSATVEDVAGLIEPTTGQGAASVIVASDLDFRHAQQLSAALESCVRSARGGCIQVDMSAVDSIDSTALCVLIKALRAAQARGGSLSLQGVRQHLRRTLQISGLAALFGLPPLRIERSGSSGVLLRSDMRKTDWQITESVAACDPNLVQRLRDLAVTAARESGARDDDISDIRLAAGEALANAAVHSRDGAERISLRCLSCASAFVMEVVNEGKRFDSASVKPPDIEAADIRGLGLHLMRETADEVVITHDKGTNHVRMVKWLGGSRTEN